MKKLIIFTVLLAFASTGLKAQEITSFPSMSGESFYQDKTKLSWKEIDAIMQESQVAEMHWQKAKKQAIGGLIGGTANLGATVWLLSNLDKNESLVGPAVAVAGTGIIAAIFFKSSMNNKRTAILEYNDALDKKTSYRLLPISNGNGVGLTLKF